LRKRHEWDLERKDEKGRDEATPAPPFSWQGGGPSMTSDAGKGPVPGGEAAVATHRLPVLSTVEVKEMGREKMVLPLADVQNHLSATARNERRGPYEQCHACHRTARIA
jgi:hypothetical protein